MQQSRLNPAPHDGEPPWPSNLDARLVSDGEEVLVYRYASSHEEPLISQRVQLWLLGACVIAVLAYAAWSLRGGIAQQGMDGLFAMGSGFVKNLLNRELAWITLLKPALLIVFFGVRWLWNRHLRLYITREGLRQEHRLPLGLHHLFGQNWQVSWSDVRSVSTRRSNLTAGAIHHLAFAELVVQPRRGRQRVLKPSFWFRPDDPPRPRLKPMGSYSPFQFQPSNPWASPENNAQLARAFAGLRLIEAIHQLAPAPGFDLPWPDAAPANGSDLNRQPEVLVLLGSAILVFMTGWGLMLYAPTIHLHASPTWGDRAAWALGSLVLWALALRWWRQQQAEKALAAHEAPPGKREPLSKPAIAFAAVLWAVAVAFVAEPLLAHAAQLGRTDQRLTYRFTAADGWARPLGHEAAHVPPIQLPAESRLAWIKSGTEVELTTVKGRFGVWVYNDAPLRHLADTQGVR